MMSVLPVATSDLTVVHLRVNESGKQEDYDVRIPFVPGKD
jgi:hypothetical protein